MYLFNDGGVLMDVMGGLGSLAAAGVGYLGQQETNKAQAEMQQQQMQFQERMSSTAYQRASLDMKAAGLNPMMMASGGMNASSPAGSPSSPLVKSGLDADAIQKAVSTAFGAMTADAQVKNIEADTVKKKAEAVSELSRPGLIGAQTGEHVAGKKLKEVTSEHGFVTLPVSRNAARTAAAELGMGSARDTADVLARYGRKGSEVLRPVADFFRSAKDVQRMSDHW
ncbi:MAG: DNA pilot protein [Microvirus sp.]|nr:MAG: DNA pilot protein [Microvirus sp.]